MFAAVAAAAILVCGLHLLWKAIKTLWLGPWLFIRAFQKQGVPCVPYRLSLSRLRVVDSEDATSFNPALRPPHNVAPFIAPRYYDWKNLHGDLFLFWVGYRPILPITKPEQMKEILYNKSAHFEQITTRKDATDLQGDSVSALKGERWALHRRIVSPAFFPDKLKGMTPAIISCVNSALHKWEGQLEDEVKTELDVYQEFKEVTADIIAHCAFGTSYEEGRLVFQLQEEQKRVILGVLQSIYIPGRRYLPTPQNWHAQNLKKKIESIVKNIIEKRAKDYAGYDLLKILLDSTKQDDGLQKNPTLSLQEIVDECKLFFWAGHETTATLMTWAFMLLARNPEWQEKAREEVFNVCGKELPTHEGLHNLKIAGMILNETLRLYPPAPYLTREAIKKTRLGNVIVPAKTILLLPVIDFHYEKSWWGEDVADFKPQRFADGLSGACRIPAAFCPFSMGPRNCLGERFAMLEAKAILAMTLQRFSFSLSPGYVHSPIATFTLMPQYGMQVVFEKLH